MNLNISSGDKMVSIIVVYRMTPYGTEGYELKNAIIGNNNPGWDYFISIDKDQNFVVSNAKKRIYII